EGEASARGGPAGARPMADGQLVSGCRPQASSHRLSQLLPHAGRATGIAIGPVRVRLTVQGETVQPPRPYAVRWARAKASRCGRMTSKYVPEMPLAWCDPPYCRAFVAAGECPAGVHPPATKRLAL